MKVISPKRLLQSVFPTVRNGSIFNASSLDLQFARTKTLDPRVTFTRASSGTYVDSQGVIRTATTNEARFDHNPTTGESLGLLVEESRTNLLLRSEELDNAAWNSAAGARTVTANQTIAPDGTASADLVTADGTNTVHFVSQAVTVTNIPYAYSVYAKANTATVLYIRAFVALGQSSVGFNLSTGAVIAEALGGVGRIQPLANGWYRCSMLFTPAAATGSIGLYIDDILVNNSSNSIYLWGAQLEAGSFPTSYIPTTTAAATRSADVASITGGNFSSWYRQDEGTVFADATKNSSGTSGFPRIAQISDSTNNNAITIIWAESISRLYGAISTGGVAQADIGNNSVAQAARHKTALAVKINDFAISNDGLNAVTDASGSMPLVDRLFIGKDVGASSLNGTIRRLTYWPQRLPDTTLQQITQ